MKSFKSIVILTVLLFISANLTAQEEEIDRWDNWFLGSNKIVFGGKDNFQHSHELQWRVNNNMSTLKEWFYEGVFTYSPNAKWEISPDFRASIKPDKKDFRFGLGGVYKTYFKDMADVGVYEIFQRDGCENPQRLMALSVFYKASFDSFSQNEKLYHTFMGEE